MGNFREQEARCEAVFAKEQYYWHLYTSGIDTPLVFILKEDLEFAMNLLCQAVMTAQDVRVFAFALMSNHLHVLISGTEDEVMSCFTFFRRRLARDMKKNGRMLPVTFSANLKRVADLKAFRDTLVYIHRNGYVAYPQHTPFSYSWGTGPYYFNIANKGDVAIGEISVERRRKMFRGRDPRLPEAFLVNDGYISPTSYCAINEGMKMFRDAHHYFSTLTKDVEAYSSMALELGDKEFLTDNELFKVAFKIMKASGKSLRNASMQDKMSVAKELHYQYRASNAQLSRTLGLLRRDVDTLFPLKAER